MSDGRDMGEGSGCDGQWKFEGWMDMTCEEGR
jgi:hypothetical protein